MPVLSQSPVQSGDTAAQMPLGVAVGWTKLGFVVVAANQRGERDAGAGEVPVRPQGAHRGPGDADSEQPELPHKLSAEINDHCGTLRLLVFAITLHWHSQQPKNIIRKKALTIFIYRFCSLF